MHDRRPQLDSLRAVAVTTVLFAHFWMPETELSVWGVRLFFVLSGYLLTGILLAERDAAVASNVAFSKVLKGFYARRLLRIWPAYFAALAIALAGATAAGDTRIWDAVLWHALFASNIYFFVEQQWFPLGHFWSLGVEEQFYIVLPLAVLFIHKPRVGRIFLVSIALAFVYRAAVALTVPGKLDFYALLPFAQMDALGGGALLAWVEHRKREIDWKRLLLWSLPLTLALVAAPFSDPLDFVVVKIVSVIPMVALVAGASAGMQGLAGDLLSSRPTVWIGRISYGIYLYHPLVGAAAKRVGTVLGYQVEDGPFAFLLFSALTILVAMCSWVWLERPLLSLRRYFPRRSAYAGDPK